MKPCGRIGGGSVARVMVTVALLVGAAWLRAGDRVPSTSSPAERVALELMPTGAMRLEPRPLAPPHPAGNPATPAKVELGRLLFFDPILSTSRKVSCGTCHHPQWGWADGRAIPVGLGGEGLGIARMFRGPATLPLLTRHVPSLLDVGFNGLVADRTVDPESAPMFWDGRVQGLERQALVPIGTLGEMRDDQCTEREAVLAAVDRVGGIPEYRERFRAGFGGELGEGVTARHLAQALAAFERSLVTSASPFDRFLSGDSSALNAEQQRGLRSFVTAGCAECHGGPMLSDYQPHFLGVPEPPGEVLRAFRTPTLRNLRRTAPYMHNGSLAALRDVLLFYDQLQDAASETLDGGDATTQPRLDPLLRRLRVRPEEFSELEAFLASLDGDEPSVNVPEKVPSGLPLFP